MGKNQKSNAKNQITNIVMQCVEDLYLYKIAFQKSDYLKVNYRGNINQKGKFRRWSQAKNRSTPHK